MPNDHVPNLEKFLAKIEGETDNLLKISETMSKTLKVLRSLAREGNLRDLARSLESLKRAFTGFTEQIENSQNSWHFDHEKYFSTRQFHEELRATADTLGVLIHERDGKLYCYPSVISVSQKEPLIRIDRKTEKRLRPSYLVKHLKELKKRPQQARPDEFLESLFAAYLKVTALTEVQLTTPGPVVTLLEIYELLTLLPGLTNEYTLQEFARDIYVLDQNRSCQTKKGFVLDFPASTALRSTRGIISAITPDGEEKRYYGLRFMPKEREGTIP